MKLSPRKTPADRSSRARKLDPNTQAGACRRPRDQAMPTCFFLAFLTGTVRTGSFGTAALQFAVARVR
jgi:hypothetical protein